MKITRVEAFPIRAPRSQRLAAAQAVLTHSDFALVVIETDEGITGYGEVSSALYYYRLGPSHAYDINAYLGPALIGQDPAMGGKLWQAGHRLRQGRELSYADPYQAAGRYGTRGGDQVRG